MDRIKARIVVATAKKVVADIEDMWFDNEDHLERYVEGLCAGYALTHSKTCSAAAYIGDNYRKFVGKNLSWESRATIEFHVAARFGKEWSDMAETIDLDPERLPVGRLDFPDSYTTPRLRKLSNAISATWNVDEVSYDSKLRMFFISMFNRHGDATSAIYGPVRLPVNKASVEEFDGKGWMICVSK